MQEQAFTYAHVDMPTLVSTHRPFTCINANSATYAHGHIDLGMNIHTYAYCPKHAHTQIGLNLHEHIHIHKHTHRPTHWPKHATLMKQCVKHNYCDLGINYAEILCYYA